MHIPSKIPTSQHAIHVLGAACGRGANDPHCAHGPQSLRSGGLEPTLRRSGLDLQWRAMLRAHDDAAHSAVDVIADLCRRLAEGVGDALAAGARFTVLGGDHSCAIGTWSGAYMALRDEGPIGLVWIDAHLDSHTPETSPSGNVHGMPLACLLGYGARPLTALAGPGPALDPAHVCVVGVRSFEHSERELLQRLGVRVFFMDECQRRGLSAVMADAIAIARNGTAGFGVSIDLDAVDPRDAPGVSLPVAGGLRGLDLAAALQALPNSNDFLGIEIAEFNPYRDDNRMTARLVEHLLAAGLSREEQP